jgi:hypothetical protein
VAVSILDAMSSANGNPSSFTISSGNNRWLIAFIHWREADGVDSLPSLTWGGQSMTRQQTVTVGPAVAHGVALFVLDEAGIAAGSGTTVSLSWDNAPQQNTYGIISIQDANQTVTDSNTASENSSTEIDLTLTGAANGFCIGGYTLNDNFNGSFTWQNSFTEQYDLTQNNQNMTAGTLLTASSGSVTIDANNAGTIFRTGIAGATFSSANTGSQLRQRLYV